MPRNAYAPAPSSPGRWVDEERCTACGAVYEEHRAWPSFSEAHQRIRARAQAQGDEGGGYRSRGPVLWELHLLKLESWYQSHAPCGAALHPCRGCDSLCPWCD